MTNKYKMMIFMMELISHVKMMTYLINE